METQTYDTSPPRTPTSQAARVVKAKGMAGVARVSKSRPSVQGVFGQPAATETSEGNSQVDHRHNRSISHDLSWSPNRQRVSVVDNMLLSLDQFSGAGTAASYISDYGNYDADARHRYTFHTPPTGRSRAQTASSASSDYNTNADSPATKTRTHRSNSSQNFQSSLGRIDSVRRASNGKEEDILQEQSPRKMGNVQPNANHPRRSSKGSGSSSFDYGRLAGGQWQRMPGRRSASFDHGYTRPELVAALTKPSFIPTTQAEPTEFYDSLYAAPTPTVPAGPRRNEPQMASPVLRPDSSMSATKGTTRVRGSVRSPSIFNRSERSISPQKGDSRDRVERPSNLRQQSTTEVETGGGFRADTPERSGPGAHGLAPSAPNSATPGKEKERPGFFRRVFGSNKATYLPSDTSPSNAKRNMSEPMNVMVARSENEPSNQPGSQAPQKDSKPKRAEKAKEPPSLNKKPSFFRRRKKSISDNVPVPEPLPQLNSKWTTVAPGPDSPSSLWNALDPYLQTRQSDAEAPYFADEVLREVDPNRKASIRPINRSEDSNMVVRNSPKQDHRAKNSRDLKISTDTKSPGHDSDGLTAPVHHARSQSDVDKALPTPPSNTRRKENTKSIGSVSNKEESTVTTTTTTTTTAADGHYRQASDIVTTAKSSNSPGSPVQKTQRLWLLGNDSNEEIAPPPRPPNTTPAPAKALDSPIKVAPVETDGSVPELPSVVPVLGAETETQSTPDDQASSAVVKPPTSEEHEQALKLFNGESGFEVNEAATWLGEEGSERARVRTAFMELFDWRGISILAALRSFCRQIKLMAETQQLDRVIDALSQRWCECNPRHGFKATDVVHTICFSVVLLNTDLHMADIEQKMTRSQFVKNTLPTIRRVVADAAPDAFNSNTNAKLPPPRPPPAIPDAVSGGTPRSSGLQRPPLSTQPSTHSDSDGPYSVPVTPTEGNGEDCGPLVIYPFNGKQPAWELQIEVVLKNFYNSIRQVRLPLQASENARPPAQSQPSSASLSVSGGLLRRSNSLVSKAGSESVPARGRLADGRTAGGARWSSKPRSRPRFYPNSIAQSSRTSFDDDASAISPSASSMWSRVSFGKTGTSMSVHSMASSFPTTDYQQSIGFANALSRTIIREEMSGDGEESLRMRPLLEDESLELAGSPWAKEGILKHKHHLESVDKRARDRNWVESFAVIEKGWMRLFQFNMNSKSVRSRMRNKQIAGGVVGGGNWTENAEPLGSYLLRQSIASALPPPGYSKARPHVWALSLPNGAVHLFQVGTPEIVREFVSSANYWSARMSKEPLVGGVSNIEYGWSDAVINMALTQETRPPSTLSGPRPSFQNSIRSSIDHSNTARPKIPGDRITISDWAAPAQSMMPSQLMEVDQLRALSTYVKNVEEELKRHNELRGAMQIAFSARHPNHIKAMANWEKKSAYLLHEIVKFTKYIESLEAAQAQQERVYAEREAIEKEKDAEAEALGREGA